MVHQPKFGIRFEPYRIFLFSWIRWSRFLSNSVFFCMSAQLCTLLCHWPHEDSCEHTRARGHQGVRGG